MKVGSTCEYVARFRESDGSPRSLIEHLFSAAELSSEFAGKIGLPSFGAIMGLLHDIGKYSKAFQNYIKSSEGQKEPDDVDYIDFRKAKGKTNPKIQSKNSKKSQIKGDKTCAFQKALRVAPVCKGGRGLKLGVDVVYRAAAQF